MKGCKDCDRCKALSKGRAICSYMELSDRGCVIESFTEIDEVKGTCPRFISPIDRPYRSTSFVSITDQSFF